MPNALPAWLVHDRLKSVMPTFQAIAKDKATTMGHIQRGHLEATAVPMPSPEAIDRLDEALGPLWERLLHAEQEVLRLASLRNVLLPELLSGRLRVREAIESREGGI
jgi:type I restriction enzyme S subunit